MSKSTTFFLLSLSFVIGVGIGSFAGINIFVVGVIILTAIIIIFAWWRAPKQRMVGFCLILLVGGIYRYELSLPKESSDILSFYNEKEIVTFEGIIAKEPDIRSGQSKITVQVDKVNLLGGQKHVSGNVLVSVPKYPEYLYGDRLNITGELLTPKEFDSFSYKDYLSKMGIYSVAYNPTVKLVSASEGNVVYKGILYIKSKFKDRINKIFSEPQASLQSGLLLGAKRGMSDELKDKFNLTGVSHIIVISGFHVSIVAALLMNLGLTISLNRKQALLFSAVGITFFILITGLQTSALRAGIMGGLVLLAMYSGRVSDVKNAILLAAVIMLLVNPKLLIFDVGFQLSFLATIGIIYLSPHLIKYLKFIPEFFKFRESATMTLSAQIITLPIIIYNFERFSLIAPVTNILTVPLVPIAMMLGFAATVVSFLWASLGKFIAVGAGSVLSYIIFVVERLADFKYSAFELYEFWPGWIIIYYIGIGILIWHLSKKKNLLKIRK